MKTYPFHVKHAKSGRADESSIALIITLAVMSLLLVLVLAFATVTRVDIQTATANRDLVASKYLAQAALQRAIADLASEYVYTPGATNTGVEATWSQIAPTDTVASVVNFSTNYVTDIETVILNPYKNNVPLISPGADGIIDYVALPGSSNYAQGVTPQWIGLKDTNGNLLGRIAFLASGASLCINAVGNPDKHSNSLVSGLVINTRNQGVSPAEINLVSALMAMGWSYANASNDVREILSYRYGLDANPGGFLVDDDSNNAQASSDGIDSDGDGVVDPASGSEGIDDPQEYLSQSDGTNSPTITPIGDDRVITDLKYLYTLTNFSVGMRGRFQSNFTQVQQTFVTQSPVRMDPGLINLNATNFVNDTNAFFTALTNRFQQIGYPTSNLVDQVQFAANVVGYRNTNTVNYGFAPYVLDVGGTNIVGVTRAPYINELTYQIVLRVQKDITLLPIPSTNITLTIPTNWVIAEVWYPYTNSAFPPTGPTILNYTIKQGIQTVVSPAGITPLWPPTSPVNTVAGFTIPAAATVAAVTNSTQFRIMSNNAPLGGFYSGPIGTAVDVALKGFSFSAQIRDQNAPQPIYDEWPAFSALDPLLYTNTFSNFNITNSVPGGVPGVPVIGYLTNIISVALDDPRVKSSWQVQYNGATLNAASNAAYVTIGKRNSTNAFWGTNIFYPTSTNADDYLVTVPIPGIATNTFYIPNKAYFISPVELGRVHRGQPWKTIDFTGLSTNSAVDGILLNNFTTWNPMSGSNFAYLHGRVNLNTPASQFPVWAALFAGMPLWNGSNIDYVSTGPSSMIKTSNLMTAMISVKPYYSAASLMSVAPILSTMSNTYKTTGWSDQKSDAEKEWLLNQMFNLTTTKGSGNFFTIWAWGQSLKGSTTDFSKKTVAAETLIVAMVKMEPASATNDANMRIVYFRYNPDLEFNKDLIPTIKQRP